MEICGRNSVQPVRHGVQDEELFKVLTRLSSESLKRPIFACTEVTTNINLNGAHLSVLTGNAPLPLAVLGYGLQ